MLNEKWLTHVEQGRCPHAVLIAAAPECDTASVCRRIGARYLLHTDDVSKLFDCPFYQELTARDVESVRKALSLLNAEAFDRGRRCLCIPDVHELNAYGQNALLKTLEEPPDDTLILLSGQEAAVLPTVRSRCMILRVPTEPWETIRVRLVSEGIDAKTAALCAKLSDGVYERARRFSDAEYASFRREVLLQISELCTGIRPYPEAAQLCTRTETDDEEGKAAKRKRVSAEAVTQYADILGSVLGDVLRLHAGYADVSNIDSTALLKKLRATFTISQIQGMIEVVRNGQQMLRQQANAGQTLDWILAKLP